MASSPVKDGCVDIMSDPNYKAWDAELVSAFRLY